MAVTPNSVITPQAVKCFVQQFVQGTDSAGTYKTLVTAGANGTKVTSIIATTTETVSAHVITLAITRSAVKYIIGNINLPINSGLDGTTAGTNLLNNALVAGLPVDN